MPRASRATSAGPSVQDHLSAPYCELARHFCFASSPSLLSSLGMDSTSPGQLLLTGVPGKELDPATADLFRRVQPGGYIIFGRNIESAVQLRKLIDDLRDLSAI